MKSIFAFLFVVATVAGAQELARIESPTSDATSPAVFQDDPGQTMYKKGYSAILAKKWNEARKSFTELLKNYPNSKYIDAAQYWTAYSYAQTDQKKATDLYRQFLEQYQESKYYEDAVADFEKLTLGYSRAAGLTPVPPPPPRVSEAAPVVAPWPANVGRAQPVHTGLVPFPTKKEIDPAVQLKMDAIWALGANADDPEAYETVKAIALDTKQPTELRETALQTIGRFEGHDPVAVYVQVAASGDVRLRQSAIYGIGNVANRGDERALTALRSLASDPKQQREIREASLSSLSRLDEEGMLETLSTLARTDPDEALRVQAVYMIGREGRGKEQQALAILKSIASDESQKQKVRESAVQSLSLIESGEALALLTGIATGSQDKNLRLNAVFALSRAQNGVSEDVEQTLRGIAGNRREDSELRLTALYALRASKGDGSKDFLTSLALKDDDEKVRRTALHLLIQSSENKADLLSTLIRVFEETGSEDQKLRDTALYGIASVGNDQAVAYLATVAKKNPNYELRRRAVYYLGSVGGERAKAALLDILKQQ